MPTEIATFAGGCFWCMVSPFEYMTGVEKVVVGFTGGQEADPTYEQVAEGLTEHREAFQITYDPSLCSYEQLLDAFWMLIDPTDDEGQFSDRGYTYLTAIYYHNEEQRVKAELSKDSLDKSGIFDRPIVTDIYPASVFYPAEEQQQDFHKKNPDVYSVYRSESGRDEFLEKSWGKPE